MPTIIQRIIKKLEENNIKEARLAEYLGINKSVVYAWRRRETNPPVEYIEQICTLLDVSIEWLVTGKESPTPYNLSENEKELLEHFQKLPEREQIKFIGRIEDAAARYQDQQEESSPSRTG